MIYPIQSAIRLLAPLAKRLNSVTAWISGVYSPNGTVSVRNTLDPSQGAPSLALDINESLVFALVADYLDGRELSPNARERIREVAMASVDGNSIVWRDGKASVNNDWLDAIIASFLEDAADLSGRYVTLGTVQTISASKTFSGTSASPVSVAIGNNATLSSRSNISFPYPYAGVAMTDPAGLAFTLRSTGNADHAGVFLVRTDSDANIVGRVISAGDGILRLGDASTDGRGFPEVRLYSNPADSTDTSSLQVATRGWTNSYFSRATHTHNYLTQAAADAAYAAKNHTHSNYLTVANLDPYFQTPLSGSGFLRFDNGVDSLWGVASGTLDATTPYESVASGSHNHDGTYVKSTTYSNDKDNIFLSRTSAANTYLTIADAASTYLTSADLSGYVTTGTAQAITGSKTFQRTSANSAVAVNFTGLNNDSRIAVSATRANVTIGPYADFNFYQSPLSFDGAFYLRDIMQNGDPNAFVLRYGSDYQNNAFAFYVPGAFSDAPSGNTALVLGALNTSVFRATTPSASSSTTSKELVSIGWVNSYFAPKNHTHSDYLTQAAADAAYAAKNHNHDSAYAAINHSHDLSDYATASSLDSLYESVDRALGNLQNQIDLVHDNSADAADLGRLEDRVYNIEADYITSSNISSEVQSEVYSVLANAGYLTSADLSGYATEAWVADGYATKSHTHSDYASISDMDGRYARSAAAYGINNYTLSADENGGASSPSSADSNTVSPDGNKVVYLYVVTRVVHNLANNQSKLVFYRRRLKLDQLGRIREISGESTYERTVA